MTGSEGFRSTILLRERVASQRGGSLDEPKSFLRWPPCPLTAPQRPPLASAAITQPCRTPPRSPTTRGTSHCLSVAFRPELIGNKVHELSALARADCNQ